MSALFCRHRMPNSTTTDPQAINLSSQLSRFPGLQLFAISFAALFLELMVIRWVPAVVRFVAYYSNLLLISSFLGLGLGALMARRRWNLFQWFPAVLVANVGSLILCKHLVEMPATNAEARFGAGSSFLFDYAVLVGIFILNTAVFVPLGAQIGRLFRQQPPLRAYAFDLGGSLAGTICFGIFSLYHFSPTIGMSIVAAIFILMSRRRFFLNASLLVIAAFSVPLSTSPAAFWSPYYYVTVHPFSVDRPAVSDPAPDLRTMIDPPFYIVSVNTDFYQYDATIDLHRYSDGPLGNMIREILDVEYLLPYALHPNAGNVCVVGAGGGLDVEAALLAGAQHVDAVEIDRTLTNISRRFNASDIYDNPKVQIHINDARAFFQSSPGGFDMVVFGLLDSQALFSYSNNIRLDGYIYTVESIRKAYSLLKPGGALCISFVMPRDWLGYKLIDMIRAATGRDPVVYAGHHRFIMAVGQQIDPATAPLEIGDYTRFTDDIPKVDLPTDDWPYLYLSHRAIPSDYLIVIISLMVLSAGAVGALWWTDPEVRGNSRIGFASAHFFFLGLGFLLLETKSIGDCSLYFGTTWFVTMIVVTGVLLMVLAANTIAMRLRKTSFWFYVPLLLSLLLLYVVPRDFILGLPFLGRILWALFVVPLPIFFAGLVFSTTFKISGDPATLLAANLIGATIGGFLEYLSMVTGTRALMLIVAAAYLISLLCRYVANRGSARSNPDLQVVKSGQ